MSNDKAWWENSAPDILEQAAKILGDRGKTYDDGRERSMRKIVKTFNSLTEQDLSERDGWIFMVLLKLVRLYDAPSPHLDSLLDLPAYAALLAECELKQNPNTVENKEKQCK